MMIILSEYTYMKGFRSQLTLSLAFSHIVVGCDVNDAQLWLHSAARIQ
jgi:hypothetical protein